MANHNLMLSLAGISAGLGRSPRKVSGVAAERKHLRNVPAWDREAAKTEYMALVAKAKADREAALAKWYDRYPAAMPIEYKKIDRVVSAFLIGKPDQATQLPGGKYGVETDGLELRVAGNVVAQRDSANSRFITVCPGLFGTSKADRFAANSALRHLGTGIRVSDIMRKEGDAASGEAFLGPARRGQQGRIVSPDRCMRVEVSGKIRQKALRSVFGPQPEMIGPVQQFTRDQVGPDTSPPMVPARRYQPVPKGSKKLTKKEQNALKARLRAARAARSK